MSRSSFAERFRERVGIACVSASVIAPVARRSAPLTSRRPATLRSRKLPQIQALAADCVTRSRGGNFARRLRKSKLGTTVPTDRLVSDFTISQELLLASTRFRRTLKQGGRFHAENRCELVNHRDAGAVDAPLEGTNVRTIDTGFVGQSLLGQPPLLPKFSQVASKNLSYVHAREASFLKSISPRSILDIRTSPRPGH